MSRCLMSSRAIWAMSLLKLPGGDVCRWSHGQRPDALASCCRADGLWNAVLPGRHGFVVWLAYLLTGQKRWPVFLCWLVLCACFIVLLLQWLLTRKVHD